MTHNYRFLALAFALAGAATPALTTNQLPNDSQDLATVLGNLQAVAGDPSQALVIVERNLAQDGKHWDLTLKNDHHKSITAWFIDIMVGGRSGTSRQTSVGRDFFLNDRSLGHAEDMLPLHPGRLRAFKVPRPVAVVEDSQRFRRGAYSVFTLDVGLVVFDDGTFVGANANSRVQRLFESRALEIEERLRFRRKLQRFLSRPSTSLISEVSATLRSPHHTAPAIGADYRRSNIRRELARRFGLEILRLDPRAGDLTLVPPALAKEAAQAALMQTDAALERGAQSLPPQLRTTLFR